MSLSLGAARAGKFADWRLGLRGKSLAALVLGCLIALVPGGLVAWDAIKTVREQYGLDYVGNFTRLNSYKIFAPIGRELALSGRFAESEIVRRFLLAEDDPERRALF